MRTNRFHTGCVLVLLLAISQPSSGQDVWLMKGHDARRTGQSGSYGPLSVDNQATWVGQEPGAFVINIGASVTRDAVYYGSWGLLRKRSNESVLNWDKSDGQVFARRLLTGIRKWGGPAELDIVNRCYDLPSRERDGNDIIWCGFGNEYHVTFYNGTVEGQAAIDTTLERAFFGRGDGRLFSINTDDGTIDWRYQTFNPQFVDDPDGGGEIVSSPLLVGNQLYFGTWGEGSYETNAMYSVDLSGNLMWRFPSDSSLAHRLFASAAASPDESTIYISTFTADQDSLPGYLYAFNAEPRSGGSDAERLKWKLQLGTPSALVQTTTLAVGSDGTVYVGGLRNANGGIVPTVAAVRDDGSQGSFVWDSDYVDLVDGSHLVLGIALREVGGESVRGYITTANIGGPLWNGKEEGELYALDLQTGAVLGNYDPSDDVPAAVGGVTSPAIGADGVVYFGVRGRYGNNAVNGHYFGVTFDEGAGAFTRLWNYEVDGHIEWNHPALGPRGALYGGSSPGGSGSPIASQTHEEGTIPDGSTPNFYRIGGPTSVSVEKTLAPAELNLNVFPNPAAAAPTLIVDGAVAGSLVIEVIDVLGRSVFRTTSRSERKRTVVDLGAGHRKRKLPPGFYTVIVSGSQRSALVSRAVTHFIQL